ncbi:MAG: hypothetical protein MJZ96_06440 [Paludibacteraceae bacterium]|nr:hypothetical protein [Paludibacteraceae bacterium]
MDAFEKLVQDDLHGYLKMMGEMDAMLPEAEDISGKWTSIASHYLEDGIREFGNYPMAALGWMMYVGMAVAQFWDGDWRYYNSVENLYDTLRSPRGYDAMDEYVMDEVLSLDKKQQDELQNIVGECAARTLSNLRRQRIEPSTPEAYHAFVAGLHQLYLMGAFMQLHRLGYHMERLG